MLSVEEKRELKDRKRAELLAAFRAGRLRDPLSGFLISLAVSAAVSAASYGLALLFAPKPPVRRVGELTGDLQVQQSSQGALITEIYGAAPDAQGGGGRVAANIIWTSGLRRHVTTTRTGGGKGGGGGGGGQTVETVTYDLDLACLWGRGPLLLKKLWANAEILTDITGGVGGDPSGIYEAEDYNATGEVVADENASLLQAVRLTSGEAVLVTGVPRTRIGIPNSPSYLHFRTEGGAATVEYVINGGSPVSIALPDAPVYESLTHTLGLGSGDNDVQITCTSGTAVIDYLYVAPPLPDPDGEGGGGILVRPSGLRAPEVAADAAYAQDAFPDPADLPQSKHRYNAPFSLDTDNGQLAQYATLAAAGNALITHYAGTEQQLPDPTIEAAVDAAQGAGSTPSYRRRAYTVLKQFFLTDFGGVLPNFNALLENTLIKTIGHIAASFCGRVGLAAADYDFTAVDALKVRGLTLSGQQFQPAEALQQLADAYELWFAEQDGRITAGLWSDDTPVATIPGREVGWISANDAGDDSAKALPGVDVNFTPARELPRTVTVRFRDPARDYEVNSQSLSRQIVAGAGEETVNLEFLTLTADEARAVAGRKLYRRYVEATQHPFTLPMKYLWLAPGQVVDIVEDDGFTHRLRLTAIKGGIGVLECEVAPVHATLYTQPAAGEPGVFEPPPVTVRGATVGALLDTPLLRDGDATNNNGVGLYVAARPLRADAGLAWNGAALYRYQNNQWRFLDAIPTASTMGRAASALGDFTPASGLDRVNYFDVDLYDAETLESCTEEEMLGGQNACLLGDEVLHFASAVQQSGYSNRWRLSTLLRGVRGTEYAKNDHVSEERFVLLTPAVVFVPLDLADLNTEYDYKLVTSGQDLDEAATLAFTWTGGTAKPLGPLIAGEWDEAQENVLIALTPRARVGGAAFAPNFATVAGLQRFRVFIPDAAPPRAQLITAPLTQDASLTPDPINSDPATQTHNVGPRVSAENSFVQSLCAPGATDVAIIGLRSYYETPASGLVEYYVDVTANAPDGSIAVARKVEYGVGATIIGTKELDDPSGLGNPIPVKARIELRDGLPYFYADYEDGDSEAFAAGTQPVDGAVTLWPYFWTTNGASITNPRIRAGRVTWLYTLEMREADGTEGLGLGALPVEAWQESEIVGEGYHTEAVI